MKTFFRQIVFFTLQAIEFQNRAIYILSKLKNNLTRKETKGQKKVVIED